VAEVNTQLFDAYRDARAEELGFALASGELEPELEALLAAAASVGPEVAARWERIASYLRSEGGAFDLAVGMTLVLVNERTAVASSVEWLRERMRAAVAAMDHNLTAEHMLRISVGGSLPGKSVFDVLVGADKD
jgi:hypothetical protein